MRSILGRTFLHPALSLGGVLLWGLLEFFALQRARLMNRAGGTPRRSG